MQSILRLKTFYTTSLGRAGFFILIAGLYCLPFFNFSTPHFDLYLGDDLPFHVQRFFTSLNGGLLPAYVGPFGPNGLMYGVNFYYPFLTTLWPLALLYQFLGSFTRSFYVYLFFLNILNLAIAYHCAHYVLVAGDPKEQDEANTNWRAMIFSVLYTFATYRLVNFVVRFALGEAVAMTFLPLVFAGNFSIFHDDGRKWPWLTIGMALIAHTHLLSLLLTALFLAILLLLDWRRWCKEKFFSLFRSALFAVILAAGTLLPMLEQTETFTIRSVYPFLFIETTATLNIILSQALGNQLIGYTFGPILLCILAIGLIRLVTGHFHETPSSLSKGLFLISIITLICTSNLFPWYLLQETALSLIQFPLRLFAYVTLFTSFFACTFFHLPKQPGLILWGLVAICLVFNLTGLEQVAYERSLKPEYQDQYLRHDDQGIVESRIYQDYVNYDYLPLKLYNFDEGISFLNNEMIVDGKKQPLDYVVNNGQTTISIILEKPATVDLPFLPYRGMGISEKGNSLILERSPRDTLQINLPAGEHELTVTYKTTLLTKSSWFISGAGLALMLYFTFRERLNTWRAKASKNTFLS